MFSCFTSIDWVLDVYILVLLLLLLLLPVSYTHLRAHQTVLDLVCRLLLEKKKNSSFPASLLLYN